LGWLGYACLLGAALVIASSSGCSGCRSPNAAAKKKAEDEKKAAEDKEKSEEEELKRLKKKEEKPDYELAKLTSYPDDPDQVQNFVKPGHWVTMTEQLRANNFDMSAEFELSATDRDGQPYLVEQTDFQLRLARPIGLPKGQLRTLELTTYVPRENRNEASGETRRVWFDGRLLAARNAKLLGVSREATTAMQPHENFPPTQRLSLSQAARCDRSAVVRRRRRPAVPLSRDHSSARPIRPVAVASANVDQHRVCVLGRH
jgi:hypothetical protein